MELYGNGMQIVNGIQILTIEVSNYYPSTYGQPTIHIIQLYSGITRGRVLNGALYAQRFQKLIYYQNTHRTDEEKSL